jgi:hypothetical protein
LHGPPEDEGIRINRLEGVGNMHRRQRDLIHALQNYSRDAVLVADREGAVGRYVSEWKRAGLLDEGNDWLWTQSLEEDNFSPAELVRAAKEIAAEQGLRIRAVFGTTLSRRVDQKRAAGSEVGMASELLLLVRDPKHGSFALSKRDLAERLTGLLIDELRRSGANEWDRLAEKRPILSLVQRLLLLARNRTL